ncbi:hypothetical protein ABT294_36990 [Nonomuraea sp. NPDC000554]|uniref:hypothetical protein n=1 Tax=Nonomuraea sp. NPDC000554 TaxID=3154259 RepID=UPI00331B7F7E
MSEEPSARPPARPRLTRRAFVRVAGTGATAMVLAAGIGTSPARAAPATLSPQEADMILQVARAGAVYPAAFPAFGEEGPAVRRATAARLAARLTELDAPRLELARQGARSLVSAGLLNTGRPRLLAGIARQASATQAAAPELVAVVALAVATVSAHFDPASDAAASVWLNALRNLPAPDSRFSPLTTRRPR